MGSPGFATIDFETTGLFPGKHDRAIEVAVVHSDPDGTITGRWDTLLNPGRDLGRQDIHRISAAEILRAPTFSDIAPELIELLDGRVLVAHNASFDTRFLLAELARADIWTSQDLVTLCTMQLARVYLPGSGRALVDCCAAFDIQLEGAHRASVDAGATAQLLASYIAHSEDRSGWTDHLDRAAAYSYGRVPSRGVAWYPREDALSGNDHHFLERITDNLPEFSGPDAHNDYLALLDRALLDRVLSLHEAEGLVKLAESLGISRPACEKLNLEYFWMLGAAAWSDGILTDAETGDLVAVATLLRIPPTQIDKVLTPPDVAPASPKQPGASLGGFALNPGDLVTLTGEMSLPRERWYDILVANDLVPKDAVTKKVKLVAAADPDSISGKAKKARDYGIPVVSEQGLANLLGI
ncbi:exonuclease domain-containing protein [Herbiconiux ginsengi]|uniref:DNA polymerase-3 subunit epsilon n=1 Tax=Herbiconiux ginsengi TaxID=381665 RepID=A0A1H3QR95_9MICO|nr:exonuclease domain-containing protein [Herbiconiux ginsengi]SDZ16044.1 DNA polymerase-3 subunit epsilon [Herbiconiux ginsengi]